MKSTISKERPKSKRKARRLFPTADAARKDAPPPRRNPRTTTPTSHTPTLPYPPLPSCPASLLSERHGAPQAQTPPNRSTLLPTLRVPMWYSG
jgi:hypothetical protein